MILLATAPKSNSAYEAYAKAAADIRAGKGTTFPRELQNVHADGTGFEREQGYRYPHDYPGHFTDLEFMPAELAGHKFYEPADNKQEETLRARLESLWPKYY